MASSRNTGKRARRLASEAPVEQHYQATVKEIKPLNWVQETYLNAIKHNTIVFGIGSAGTGKTYIAASYAANELLARRISKIILTRPNVETGRELGHLPGDLDEKYAPYLRPFQHILTKSLGGQGQFEYFLKSKVIEPAPLGFMRGETFENAIVLVDEAQNMTKTEFMMILSRVGRNCRVILSGDPKQFDIKDSGLLDAVKRLEGIEDIEVVHFQDSDIVRSKMCKAVIMAYRD